MTRKKIETRCNLNRNRELINNFFKKCLAKIYLCQFLFWIVQSTKNARKNHRYYMAACTLSPHDMNRQECPTKRIDSICEVAWIPLCARDGSVIKGPVRRAFFSRWRLGRFCHVTRAVWPLINRCSFVEAKPLV